jgi:hypothetical protein
MITLAHIHALPAWGQMWCLALVIYVACKWLTSTRRRTDTPAGWRDLAYLLGWPGMDADGFLAVGRSHPAPAREWAFALTKLCLGIGLVTLAVEMDPASNDLLRGWIGMVGLVFVLHFGLFHLLSCLWRAFGFNATPLMNWPICSQSLSEFWGRRWNLAFRDLTYRFLFRPWQRRLGPQLALVFGFVISGLVHDAVVSLPAAGGYGWPTAYFTVQGLALLAERSRLGRSLGLGQGLSGRLFTAAVLVLPIGWLFHRPFVCEVILPFLYALGGES